MSRSSRWSGDWVAGRFGLRLAADPAYPCDLHGLTGLALRHNPRRAHLLVSTALGKHIPADPCLVYGRGLELGRTVRERLGAVDALVVGTAETATALGHCVAEALDAPYLHSTRRRVPGTDAVAGFEEEHSHATSHRLLPEDPRMLRRGRAVVLVDDELSTGRTAAHTLAALHRLAPRQRYVLAALVDVRGQSDRAALDRLAAELGARIDVVALAGGRLEWPADFPSRAAAFVADASTLAAPAPTTLGDVVEVPPAWPPGVPDGGRHGVSPGEHPGIRQAAAAVAAAATPGLIGDRILVLGTEELMYAPLLVALELCAPDRSVRISSTTRSPVLALDDPGYPIRSAVAFDSHDDAEGGPGPRWAYNLAPGTFTDVVVVVDSDADGPGFREGLVPRLRAVCRRVHVVVLPSRRPAPPPLRGPGFGSYAADEVGWLLTDLSGVPLEAPTEEREEAVQSGGAHYAESLPVEYQPDAEYLRLFEAALAASATRIAHAVGVVTELVLAERGPRPVLASLARAGTPVGVLMRRWAARRGLELPHYAVSIVRGRGIDPLALRHLAARHDPAEVVFVDGWTGKGAIAGELAAAVTAANAELGTAFDPALAVLADPGHCVRTFGTREDFLVPSACLNSTVSGLVSRTVLNPALLRPGDYHGAKFYRQLAASDVSARFIDTVTAHFDGVAARVAADWPRIQRGERAPTWAGWAEIEQLSEAYGLGDVTLVKPGVGETTRVLLRRVPWAVLVRAGEGDDAAELAHVRLLARQRGVPVHEVDGLTYRCVGLIHPRYTRGATGADGRAAVVG